MRELLKPLEAIWELIEPLRRTISEHLSLAPEAKIIDGQLRINEMAYAELRNEGQTTLRRSSELLSFINQ